MISWAIGSILSRLCAILLAQSIGNDTNQLNTESARIKVEHLGSRQKCGNAVLLFLSAVASYQPRFQTTETRYIYTETIGLFNITQCAPREKILRKKNQKEKPEKKSLASRHPGVEEPSYQFCHIYFSLWLSVYIFTQAVDYTGKVFKLPLRTKLASVTVLSLLVVVESSVGHLTCVANKSVPIVS
jgi:hypothetical protein